MLLQTLLAVAALAFSSTNAIRVIPAAHENLARAEVPVIPGVLSLDPNILTPGHRQFTPWKRAACDR